MSEDLGKRGQIPTSTWYDRYPKIFKKSSEVILRKELKILSYGCSSGEEAATLADKYFAEDTHKIIGVDINDDVITKAKHTNRHSSRVEFFNNKDILLKNFAPFDVIFAMSVLCSYPPTKTVDDCSELITFDSFNDSVAALDNLLKKDGILCIINSNFYFEDSDVSDKYLEVMSSKACGADVLIVPRFDKKNKRVELEDDYYGVIFRKIKD